MPCYRTWLHTESQPPDPPPHRCSTSDIFPEYSPDSPSRSVRGAGRSLRSPARRLSLTMPAPMHRTFRQCSCNIFWHHPASRGQNRLHPQKYCRSMRQTFRIRPQQKAPCPSHHRLPLPPASVPSAPSQSAMYAHRLQAYLPLLPSRLSPRNPFRRTVLSFQMSWCFRPPALPDNGAPDPRSSHSDPVPCD